jgi:hypothetical protein
VTGCYLQDKSLHLHCRSLAFAASYYKFCPLEPPNFCAQTQQSTQYLPANIQTTASSPESYSQISVAKAFYSQPHLLSLKYTCKLESTCKVLDVCLKGTSPSLHSFTHSHPTFFLYTIPLILLPSLCQFNFIDLVYMLALTVDKASIEIPHHNNIVPIHKMPINWHDKAVQVSISKYEIHVKHALTSPGSSSRRFHCLGR